MNNQEGKKYDIEAIIEKCDSFETKKDLINYIRQTQIFRGRRLSFLFPLYDILKKEFIIKTLQKALITANNEKQNPGDIFISLVKKSDLMNQELYDKIFWRDKKNKERNKMKRLKRQLLKSFENLNLNDTKNKDDIK